VLLGGPEHFNPIGFLPHQLAAEMGPVYEIAVVGGGIIGLATVRQLLARGTGRVAVLEREAAVAQHQTGHNSGVIHAGLLERFAPFSLLKLMLSIVSPVTPN
jgi:glycine/D-amino acid oxidase-like deaminating enzyme